MFEFVPRGRNGRREVGQDHRRPPTEPGNDLGVGGAHDPDRNGLGDLFTVSQDGDVGAAGTGRVDCRRRDHERVRRPGEIDLDLTCRPGRDAGAAALQGDDHRIGVGRSADQHRADATHHARKRARGSVDRDLGGVPDLDGRHLAAGQGGSRLIGARVDDLNRLSSRSGAD